MPKRKTVRKQKAQSPGVTKEPAGSNALPVPAFLLQILAVILAGILIVSLTLYVLGKMPARGFWVLAIILAVIAFVVMPVMRKKFLGQS
ncbi:hypothetical protein KY359_05650 [Candidatus Woesearchaeota archaeon]|nr:hypothetical protein [Candidatus Woesearchaeota archaeon]